MDDDEISALLTPKQREYLLGNSEIEEKSDQERVIRSRIRERLSQSMLDMRLLQHELENRDLDKAFGTTETDSIREAIALMFRGALLLDPMSEEPDLDDEENSVRFEALVVAALETLYGTHHSKFPEVDTTIEINYPDKKELDEFSNDELIEALKEDLISKEMFESAYEIEDSE